MSLPRTKSAWLFFAITSGACAAFNGVFAKLFVAIHHLNKPVLTTTQHNNRANKLMVKHPGFHIRP